MNTPSSTTAGQAAWRSPLLGTASTLTLKQGQLDYWSRGSGPALVLVHGWLVNANHWRHVVDVLATDYRCITLEMPLGSHRTALHADADLSPVGCGQLIADALTALGLHNVTLVGNDSGGAYAQIALSLDASRVVHLVLTNGETPFDAFPPLAFKGLVQAAHTDEGLQALLGALQKPAIRDSAAGYGHLAKHGIDQSALLSYVMPSVHDTDILRDAAKAMRSADAAPVIAAGHKLMAQFDKPVDFIWADECPHFPLSSAQQYAARLPRARMHTIADAYSFLPEDQPGALAHAISQAIALR